MTDFGQVLRDELHRRQARMTPALSRDQHEARQARGEEEREERERHEAESPEVADKRAEYRARKLFGGGA